MTTIHTPMRLVDWLDDICVRFIINLPQEELTSVERIIFQIEEGHWYYEDFIRPLDSTLPSIGLRQFCSLVFQHCPLLAQFSDYHAAAYSEFLAYKTRVPVRGAILLNAEMNQVVLVKGWKKSAKWSFPRGKINKDEADLDCAIREVYEETGFDVRDAGLISDERNAKYIDITLREQQMRLYIFRGVPMETYFEPRTRKEISKIQWYKITELPGGRHKPGIGIADEGPKNIFYMVAPFMGPLKGWIKQQRKMDRLAAGLHAQEHLHMEDTDAETGHEDAVADAPELANAEAQHFQSLLSRMTRTGQSPLANVPEDQPMAASTEKLAFELKRLLSVGAAEPVPSSVEGLQATTNQAEAGDGARNRTVNDGQSGILLSLLRGSNPPASAEPKSIPLTPHDQVDQSPPHSHRPHHLNQPPSMADVIPPHFPHLTEANPQFPAGYSHPRGHHQQMYMQQPLGPMPGVHGQHPGHPAHQPFQNAQMSQAGIYPVSGHPVPHNRNAPPASSLPMPRMNPQFMGNGNHFRQPHVHHPQHQQPYPTFSQELPSENERLREIRELQNAPSEGNLPTSQRSAQQKTLLGLFRNTGQAAATQSNIAPVAELSAGTPRDPAAVVQHAMRAPVAAPNNRITVGLQHSARHLTSATVSGPLNEPDFETIRRNRPPVELGNGRELGQSPVPVHTIGSGTVLEAPRPFHPSSILQRQHTPATPTPANAAQVPTKAPAPAGVFDRRGQQAETQKSSLLSLFNASTANAPVATAPVSNSADLQKANLLSLFNGPSNANNGLQAPDIIGFPTNMVSMPAAHQRRLSQNESPVSPLPDRRVPYKVHTTNAPRTSQDSYFDGSTQSAVSAIPRSRVSSVTSAGVSGTGGQTPIAEDQKQFLFKYLEDAVRGGR